MTVVIVGTVVIVVTVVTVVTLVTVMTVVKGMNKRKLYWKKRVKIIFAGKLGNPSFC